MENQKENSDQDQKNKLTIDVALLFLEDENGESSSDEENSLSDDQEEEERDDKQATEETVFHPWYEMVISVKLGNRLLFEAQWTRVNQLWHPWSKGHFTRSSDYLPCTAEEWIRCLAKKKTLCLSNDEWVGPSSMIVDWNEKSERFHWMQRVHTEYGTIGVSELLLTEEEMQSVVDQIVEKIEQEREKQRLSPPSQ